MKEAKAEPGGRVMSQAIICFTLYENGFMGCRSFASPESKDRNAEELADGLLKVFAAIVGGKPPGDDAGSGST